MQDSLEKGVGMQDQDPPVMGCKWPTASFFDKECYFSPPNGTITIYLSVG